MQMLCNSQNDLNNIIQESQLKLITLKNTFHKMQQSLEYVISCLIFVYIGQGLQL